MKKNRIIVLLLILALVLTGCTEMIDDSAVRPDAEKLVEAFVQGDYQTCRMYLNEYVSDEDLQQFFPAISAELADLGEYTMTVVNWEFHTKNGETTSGYRYQIDGEGGSYYLDLTVLDGTPGFAGCFVSLAEDAAAPQTTWGIVNWLFLAVGLVGLAFVIWMVVDCAKRKMKRKWLWILLILFLTILLTFTTNESSSNFRFNLGAFLGVTGITTYASGAFEVNVYIPIGALVYFFKRRALTLPEPAPVEEMSNGEETEETE